MLFVHKVKVHHKPELTTEQAMQIFRTHFGTKYEIYRRKLSRGRLFVIKRSAWTGVIVKLIHKKDVTYFQLSEEVPSAWLISLMVLMVLTPALWPVLLVWYICTKRSAEPLLNEVKQFIATAPEFT